MERRNAGVGENARNGTSRQAYTWRSGWHRGQRGQGTSTKDDAQRVTRRPRTRRPTFWCIRGLSYQEAPRRGGLADSLLGGWPGRFWEGRAVMATQSESTARDRGNSEI